MQYICYWPAGCSGSRGWRIADSKKEQGYSLFVLSEERLERRMHILNEAPMQRLKLPTLIMAKMIEQKNKSRHWLEGEPQGSGRNPEPLHHHTALDVSGRTPLSNR